MPINVVAITTLSQISLAKSLSSATLNGNDTLFTRSLATSVKLQCKKWGRGDMCRNDCWLSGGVKT